LTHTPKASLKECCGGAVIGAHSDRTNIKLDGLDTNHRLRRYAFEGALRTTLDSFVYAATPPSLTQTKRPESEDVAQ
jgi:hypothetical protein